MLGTILLRALRERVWSQLCDDPLGTRFEVAAERGRASLLRVASDYGIALLRSDSATPTAHWLRWRSDLQRPALALFGSLLAPLELSGQPLEIALLELWARLCAESVRVRLASLTFSISESNNNEKNPMGFWVGVDAARRKALRRAVGERQFALWARWVHGFEDAFCALSIQPWSRGVAERAARAGAWVADFRAQIRPFLDGWFGAATKRRNECRRDLDACIFGWFERAYGFAEQLRIAASSFSLTDESETETETEAEILLGFLLRELGSLRPTAHDEACEALARACTTDLLSGDFSSNTNLPRSDAGRGFSVLLSRYTELVCRAVSDAEQQQSMLRGCAAVWMGRFASGGQTAVSLADACSEQVAGPSRPAKRLDAACGLTMQLFALLGDKAAFELRYLRRLGERLLLGSRGGQSGGVCSWEAETALGRRLATHEAASFAKDLRFLLRHGRAVHDGLDALSVSVAALTIESVAKEEEEVRACVFPTAVFREHAPWHNQFLVEWPWGGAALKAKLKTERRRLRWSLLFSTAEVELPRSPRPDRTWVLSGLMVSILRCFDSEFIQTPGAPKLTLWDVGLHLLRRGGGGGLERVWPERPEFWRLLLAHTRAMVAVGILQTKPIKEDQEGGGAGDGGEKTQEWRVACRAAGADGLMYRLRTKFSDKYDASKIKKKTVVAKWGAEDEARSADARSEARAAALFGARLAAFVARLLKERKRCSQAEIVVQAQQFFAKRFKTPALSARQITKELEALEGREIAGRDPRDRSVWLWVN